MAKVKQSGWQELAAKAIAEKNAFSSFLRGNSLEGMSEDLAIMLMKEALKNVMAKAKTC